jgi:hypothetical protein
MPPDAIAARPDSPMSSLMRIMTPLLPVLLAATAACPTTGGKRTHAPPPARPSSQPYPGFGFRTTGGAGRQVFTVRTLADSGDGSLRDALAKAARTGGTIRFAVGGGIRLESSLDVPGHTTIDGTSAPAPGITLWGARVGASGSGVVNVYEGNVILRGLRIRDGMNDGVQIAPKRHRPIANVVVDHCSITNDGDGGIDITGRDGLEVTDVAIVGNYIAGNGGSCAKGWCGGGSLAKYGVDRLSYYYNFWDKNLRRTPSVSGEHTVADVRYNVVRSTKQGGIQIRDGARADLVGNTLGGPMDTAAAKLWGGHAYVQDTPSDLGGAGDVAPLQVPHLPPAKTAAAVTREAGAQPRDTVDTYYVDTATTLEQVKAHALTP